MMLQGTVFDYYVDEASGSMLSWETKVQGFQYMPDSFSNLFVPTVETTRLTYFLNSLMENKHYVMFVGNTGMMQLQVYASCHEHQVWLSVSQAACSIKRSVMVDCGNCPVLTPGVKGVMDASRVM